MRNDCRRQRQSVHRSRTTKTGDTEYFPDAPLRHSPASVIHFPSASITTSHPITHVSRCAAIDENMQMSVRILCNKTKLFLTCQLSVSETGSANTAALPRGHRRNSQKKRPRESLKRNKHTQSQNARGPVDKSRTPASRRMVIQILSTLEEFRPSWSPPTGRERLHKRYFCL